MFPPGGMPFPQQFPFPAAPNPLAAAPGLPNPALNPFGMPGLPNGLSAPGLTGLPGLPNAGLPPAPGLSQPVASLAEASMKAKAAAAKAQATIAHHAAEMQKLAQRGATDAQGAKGGGKNNSMPQSELSSIQNTPANDPVNPYAGACSAAAAVAAAAGPMEGHAPTPATMTPDLIQSFNQYLAARQQSRKDKTPLTQEQLMDHAQQFLRHVDSASGAGNGDVDLPALDRTTSCYDFEHECLPPPMLSRSSTDPRDPRDDSMGRVNNGFHRDFAPTPLYLGTPEYRPEPHPSELYPPDRDIYPSTGGRPVSTPYGEHYPESSRDLSSVRESYGRSESGERSSYTAYDEWGRSMSSYHPRDNTRDSRDVHRPREERAYDRVRGSNFSPPPPPTRPPPGPPMDHHRGPPLDYHRDYDRHHFHRESNFRDYDRERERERAPPQRRSCERLRDIREKQLSGQTLTDDEMKLLWQFVDGRMEEHELERHRPYESSPPPGLPYRQESYDSHDYFMPSGSPPADRISRPLPGASPSTSAGTEPAGSPQTTGSSSTKC